MSVTDEQINDLRAAALFNVNSTHAGIRNQARNTVRLCDRALDSDHPLRDVDRRELARLFVIRASIT